jgi:hypothetical protein
MDDSGDSLRENLRLKLPERAVQRADSPSLPAPASPLDSLDSYEGAAVMRARNRAYGINPWLFVIATTLNTTVASVLSVIITLGVVNQDRSAADTQDVPPGDTRAAGTGREPPLFAAPGRPAVTLQPIGAPDRPLRLAALHPARFPLHILPDSSGNEPFTLRLSGAPAGTLLPGLNRIGPDTWLLPPGSMNRLEIVMPEWSTSVFEIAVALRRINGALAAETTAWISVPPPAGAVPAPLAADEAAARELAAKADHLVAKGDIVGARALYQRAAELGSAPAALALGTTYDPSRLWSLGVLGLTGNRERARQWYQRASELGNAEAKARLAGPGF